MSFSGFGSARYLGHQTIVLEQPTSHLVCGQEVYLKNSVDWKLVRGDVNGFDLNEIIRFPCPASLLNEAFLRVCRGNVPKRTLVVSTSDKPWFDDRCVLAHRAKQSAYRVGSRSRTQFDWE